MPSCDFGSPCSCMDCRECPKCGKSRISKNEMSRKGSSYISFYCSNCNDIKLVNKKIKERKKLEEEIKNMNNHELAIHMSEKTGKTYEEEKKRVDALFTDDEDLDNDYI